MNPLVAKEVRLLLPAYGMAILLAIVPVWLLPMDPNNTPAAFALFPFSFGAVMLALCSFGREFGLRTFPLILAQPLERTRIWRTKITVLAAALATVWGVWCLSCAACVYAGLGRPVWRETVTIGGATVAVTLAGGLWTTLLLRQMIAAFWFTLLIPGAILMAIGLSGGTDWMMFAALGLYSLAGFLFARWEFLHVQEASWTGGVISFPGWRAADAAARSSVRRYRPVAALFWKEFQLHQVGLMGVAFLFVVHLGVVFLRKQEVSDAVRKGLEVFGGIWLVVPLLAGGQSVAEERKLGTWAEQLSLPISSRVQFIIKLFFVLIIGGVLSPILLETVEAIGKAIGAGSDIGTFRFTSEGNTYDLSIPVFSALALIGFYASTLSRNLIQALGIAVFTMAALGAVEALAENPVQLFGMPPWRGSLIYYFALPTLVITFCRQASHNFKHVSENWRLWRRNVLEFSVVISGIAIVTTATFHRAWELVTPLEPGPGPALLSGEKPPRISSNGSGSLAVLLPDGRLWVDRIAYVPGRLFLAFREGAGIRGRGRWISLSGSQVLPGSNWVSAVAAVRETVGIRSDGSLWVSEKPREPWNHEGQAPEAKVIDLARFGNQTDWQSVVLSDYWWSSMYLLKQDGSLWHWGTNSFPPKETWPGLRSFEPTRFEKAANGVTIASVAQNVYLWERGGSAWVVNPRTRAGGTETFTTIAGIQRLASLDQTRWRSFGGNWHWVFGVSDNGTLWAWNPTFQVASSDKTGLSTQLIQIGIDSDWSAVAGDFNTLAALKNDGSLWQWRWGNERLDRLVPAANAPVRLGKRNDWVAIASATGSTISLAADGTLWYWWGRGLDDYRESDQPLLSASRRPSKIGNIFGSPE